MLREFAPQHQNGRMVIGSIVVFMGLCMSIKSLMVELAQLEEGDKSLAGLSIATWIAILANIILYAAVVFIVYTRSVLKHDTLFTGQDARIVAWVPRAMDETPWKDFPFPASVALLRFCCVVNTLPRDFSWSFFWLLLGIDDQRGKERALIVCRLTKYFCEEAGSC